MSFESVLKLYAMNPIHTFSDLRINLPQRSFYVTVCQLPVTYSVNDQLRFDFQIVSCNAYFMSIVGHHLLTVRFDPEPFCDCDSTIPENMTAAHDQLMQAIYTAIREAYQLPRSPEKLTG